jgi:hypothetical protein
MRQFFKDENQGKFGQKISGIAFVNGISLSQVLSIQRVIGNEMYCHKMRKSEEEISDKNFSFHRTKQSASVNTSHNTSSCLDRDKKKGREDKKVILTYQKAKSVRKSPLKKRDLKLRSKEKEKEKDLGEVK